MRNGKSLKLIVACLGALAAAIVMLLGANYSMVTGLLDGKGSGTPRAVAASSVREISATIPPTLDIPSPTIALTAVPSETRTVIASPVPATNTPFPTAAPSATPVPSTFTPTTKPSLTFTPTSTSLPVTETPDLVTGLGTGLGASQENNIDSWVTARQFMSLPGFVYSPAGIFQSMSVVSLGASDRSQDQFEKFLGLSNNDQCQVLRSFEAKNNSDMHLTVSLWGDARSTYEPDYLGLLKNCSQVAPGHVSQTGILSWIATEISNFNSASVPSLVPRGVGPGDGLMIVSASRFWFDWSSSSTSVQDGRGTFVLPNGQARNSPYRRTVGTFGFYQDAEYSSLVISTLDDRSSLALITPRMGGGFSYDFYKSTTAEKIEQIVDSAAAKQIDARLPSFDVVSTWDLTDPLVTNGVPDVFFPGIASLRFKLPGGEPYVSKILQIAQLRLGSTELNSGNANATLISREQPQASAPVFFLDKPFIAVVVDRETNRILAKGYVLEPR